MVVKAEKARELASVGYNDCTIPLAKLNRDFHERATRFILVAVTLIGIAYIALLPPWEGFDEYAHWSSIQQIADTRTLPYYGHAYISADVNAYAGPMPYNSIAPFSEAGRETYRSFRERGGRSVEEPAISRYRPGVEINWEAQHPPLFYLLMVPVYEMTKAFGWVHHLFVLRLAAWVLAVAGLAVGAIATERIVGKEEPAAGPIMAGFPFLIPQFFPEMARVGNDSLCLFFMGIAWALTVWLLRRDARLYQSFALGMVLGLGLLTKAFFLPISAGIGALLAIRWWRDRSLCKARDLLAVVAIASLVGGWWYVRNYMLYGSFVGANDFLQANGGIGFWEGMRHNFSIIVFLRGLVTLAVTFSLGWTWSLVWAPEMLFAIPLTLLAVTIGPWLLRLRDMEPLDWAPAIIVGPFLLGLFAHLLYGIAIGRLIWTPGWYLHVVAAPIAFAMVRGWRTPRLNVFLLVASVGAMAVVWGLQLSLFSGCSTKSGALKYYSFEGSDCIVDPIMLGVLTIPVLSAIAIALAIPFLLVGLRSLRGVYSGG
jgi:4-amino-4-deoxy-L-arabinose transferase-like glycosyltransferase